MGKLADIKNDLETIRGLILHAGLGGGKLLDIACELVESHIRFCFAVVKPEVVSNYVRSEMVSLLHGVGSGRIAPPTHGYLWTRYQRLVKNLLAQGAIKPLECVYFSQIPLEDVRSWEEAAERFLFHHREEDSEQEAEESNGETGSSYLKASTLNKEMALRRVKSFSPGCLREKRHEEPRQLRLF